MRAIWIISAVWLALFAASFLAFLLPGHVRLAFLAGQFCAGIVAVPLSLLAWQRDLAAPVRILLSIPAVLALIVLAMLFLTLIPAPPPPPPPTGAT